jgi:hypothetical protein
VTAITVISEDDIRHYRELLIPWAKANHIDPTTVAVQPIVVIEASDNAIIGYAKYLTDTFGKHYMDPLRRDRAATASHTVPMLVQPPSGLGRRLCTCTTDQLDPECSDHCTDRVHHELSEDAQCEARIVLIKPGDVLVIGNVGALPEESWGPAVDHLTPLKEALGLAGVVVFEGDVNLAAVAAPHEVEQVDYGTRPDDASAHGE